MGERAPTVTDEGPAHPAQNDALSVPWDHFKQPEIPPIIVEKEDWLNKPGKVEKIFQLATITLDDNQKIIVTTRPEEDSRSRVVTIGLKGMQDRLSDMPDTWRLRQSRYDYGGVEHTFFRPISDTDTYAVSVVYERNGPDGGDRTLEAVKIVDQQEATRRIAALGLGSLRQDATDPTPPQSPTSEASAEQSQTEEETQQSADPAEQRPAALEAAASNRSRKKFMPGRRNKRETPERVPQETKDDGRTSRRPKLRARVLTGTTAVAATAVILTGAVDVALSAPAPTAHSAATNGSHSNHAEGGPVWHGADIGTIGGAAVRAILRESPDNSHHHAVPVQVKPTRNLDVAPWTAAARAGGEGSALSRTEGAITSWDTIHPKEAVHLGLSDDGKWQVIRMDSNNQDAGERVIEGINRIIYGIAA